MFNIRKRNFSDTENDDDDDGSYLTAKKTKFKCTSQYFANSSGTRPSKVFLSCTGENGSFSRLKELFPQLNDIHIQEALTRTHSFNGAVAYLSQQSQCEMVVQNSFDSDDDVMYMKQKSSRAGKKKTKRCRFVSEGSSSDDGGAEVTASAEQTTLDKSSILNNGSKPTSQLAQLSSSDEEDCETAATVPDLASSSSANQKSKYVISTTQRSVAGPRSSVDILQRPDTSRDSSKGKSNPHSKVLARNKIDDGLDIDKFDSGEDWSSDDEDRISEEKQRKILHFFQESSAEELTTVAECSVKKADIIISLRPFTSWEDLLVKFTETKHLSQKLLWSCIDLLQERRTLCVLMKKCSQISKKLGRQFNEVRDLNTQSPRKSSSVTIVDQPRNIPSNLVLKPYQMIGLNWIALLDKNRVNGILADEMGLGKTVQTISFFAYLHCCNAATGPHLIVVPTSTLANWVREFNTWCPTLSVLQYSGSQAERKDKRQALLRGLLSCDVILTTYNLAVSTPEDRSLFRKLGVHYAVFDEGHMLKNMSSQRFQQLLKIKAERRLLLTGTPLQNNLLELMSLLRFVMPHMFEETTSTLVRIFSHSSQETSSSFARKRIEHAKQIMQPFVLRRLKRDVLHQLPSKEEQIVHCELGSAQAELYDKVKTTLKNRALKQALPKSELRSVFMELRKVANHPLLRREIFTMTKLRKMAVSLKNDVDFMDSDENYLVEDMEVMSDFELHNFCAERRLLSSFKLPDKYVFESGKFLQLDKILPQIAREGRRVLIFSQFTMVMDIMEAYLKYRSHKYLRLDGSTPIAERIGLIDTFNNDQSYFIFVLSTKAGGLGINLTSASVVILHDIDCNPYNDKQAEDRCHRVGQTQSVKVIKLISKGTIEERMYEYAQHKLQLEKEMTKNDEVDLAALISDSLGS